MRVSFFFVSMTSAAVIIETIETESVSVTSPDLSLSEKGEKMSNDTRLDIIVFGATGYTGKYVVENLVKTIDKENQDLTWGVASRNERKTRDALVEVSKFVDKNLDGISVIIADINDEDSILRMCKRGRIIINCVGPYSLYGEIVVKNCILAKSHHVDLAGEPYFLEGMQVKYHQKAAEAGVYIVGACGFDSIPADLGIIHMQKNCANEIAWIDTFAKMEPGKSGSVINHGTWDSAVQFFADLSNLKRIRRELYDNFFKKNFPTYKHKNSQKYLPHYPKDIGELTVPFWDTDKFVVKRTQLQNFIEHNKRPVQMSAYFVLGSWLMMFGLGFVGMILAIFGSFEAGRNLLRKHPSFFTAGNVSPNGPTRQQVSEARFEMTLVGHGYKEKLASPTDEPRSPPEQLMVARWRGPEAAYAATSIILIQAAITILKEGNAIAYKGGVLTPGLTFQDTTLIERLRRHSVVFEIIK